MVHEIRSCKIHSFVLPLVPYIFYYLNKLLSPFWVFLHIVKMQHQAPFFSVEWTVFSCYIRNNTSFLHLLWFHFYQISSFHICLSSPVCSTGPFVFQCKLYTIVTIMILDICDWFYICVVLGQFFNRSAVKLYYHYIFFFLSQYVQFILWEGIYSDSLRLIGNKKCTWSHLFSPRMERLLITSWVSEVFQIHIKKLGWLLKHFSHGFFRFEGFFHILFSDPITQVPGIWVSFVRPPNNCLLLADYLTY